MKKLNISKFAVIAFIAVGTVFATSCSKDAGEETIMPGEGTRVVISVGGIDNGSSASFNKIQASARQSINQSSNGSFIKGDAFDVLVSQPKSISQLGLKDKIRAAASGAEALKAEIPMTNGNAYRVFLRKLGETTLTSAALTSGTAGSIAVEKGASYEWFAVSYNSSTAVPEPTSGTDVELSDISSLLYANGEFAVGSGDGDVVVPLAIVFKPRVTKALIEINTMGMFAPVASATINVTGLYAAPESIDVVTGNLTGGTQTLNIAYGDFEPVAGSDGQRLVTEAYVAGNATEPIEVSVSNLSITLDDGSARDFGTSTLTQAFEPQAGMEQNIVLNFIESPLTFGGVQWSRSNLYYNPSVLPSNPYRFNHNNTYSTTVDPNSYFSFHGHLPRILGSAVESEQKDPCALVYPAGAWKTPAKNDLDAIQNQEGVLGNLLGDIGAVLGLGATPGAVGTDTYLEFTPTAGVNTAYGSATSGNNKLRFNYNGQQTNVGLIEGAITLNLADSKGTTGAFWTNQQGVNLLGLVGVGSWNYLGYTGRTLLGGAVPKGSAAASLLDIDLVGLNVLSSALMNVRCIRDTNWETARESASYNPYPDLTDL